MNTLLEVVALNDKNKNLLDEIKKLQEDLGKADTVENFLKIVCPNNISTLCITPKY